MPNAVVGKEGELLAVNYLKSKGYEILKTNYRCGRNEIDIIARIDNFMVFIEVKTRSRIDFGYPEEMVSGNQEDRIRDAAESFIESAKWMGNVRFDIIAIHRKKKPAVFHVRDAF